jgi:RNA polymerase sigma-70 factor (ECF subfamily)
MADNLTFEQVREQVDTIYRTESRRIFATLIRLLGDFDLAEDAMHEAFRVAMEQWPRDGIPDNPRAWLVSTGRFKAIDTLRKQNRFDASLGAVVEKFGLLYTHTDITDAAIKDDQLRLIFTCCHPLLSFNARVALTLREVCGLTTEAIAHAFLTNPPTLAQRIVRAKAQIRDARIPYEVPSHEALPDRLSAVLQVIYLVFNEGYAASSGKTLTRPDISGEAIRLGRLLVDLLPEPEAVGLLSLMLLHESRRIARTSPDGDIVLLEDQDRALWNQVLMAEGSRLARQAWRADQIGPYTIQAAIAAVHTAAPTFDDTDWAQIVGLYDLLLQVTPSPIVEISRAVAIAMRDGPAAGLELIDEILERGDLANYHPAYVVRGDLCRRLGKTAEARTAYEQALALAEQEPEQRFIEQQLASLSG